ncbi:MAG: hypothetical protein AAGJ93_01070, partial [Bacteroidota bacterium]
MTSLSIFLYEWKHFVRSPFKVVALFLFVLAGVYGLHNGASLYHEQLTELVRISQKVEEDRKEYIAYYDEGKAGPEDRPWVDFTTPFWAIWYSDIYHLKTPSPALVYSMGQAEQYGFYKRVTFWASPYDADMTQEIANPERLQIGALDFSFTLLFLSPLLLLIFLYNLKSMEAEQGFLSLIEVQTASNHSWLLSRVLFYVSIVFTVIVGLLRYGAMLTNLFALASTAFGQMLFYSFLYLLFWAIVYYLLLRWSTTAIMGNTLKMAGFWLLFAFIIPAATLQWISMKKPANLMLDVIDAKRDKSQEIFELPDSALQVRLFSLFPEIENSSVAQDSTKMGEA